MFLNLDFSYEWWNRLYGLRFGKRYYRDIKEKLETQEKMGELLKARFPWYEKGRLASGVGGVLSSSVIGVEPFGHRFIPALFGCRVRYGDAHTPWAEHNPLSEEEIMTMPMLTMDEFSNDVHVRAVVEQGKTAVGLYGAAGMQQNLGSVMNTAIYLRPMDLFTDYYERPEMVHKLFALISNRMKLTYEYFAKMDCDKSSIGVGNCSVCMISPELYESFNRRYDLEMMGLAKEYDVPFCLHQDSNVTPYIESYRAFDYLHSFDIGFDTDVRAFRSAFPDAILNIFLYTSFLVARTPEEIAFDVRALITEAGDPALTGFSCFDIDSHVGDEKVRALYETVKEQAML